MEFNHLDEERCQTLVELCWRKRESEGRSCLCKVNRRKGVSGCNGLGVPYELDLGPTF